MIKIRNCRFLNHFFDIFAVLFSQNVVRYNMVAYVVLRLLELLSYEIEISHFLYLGGYIFGPRIR